MPRTPKATATAVSEVPKATPPGEIIDNDPFGVENHPTGDGGSADYVAGVGAEPSELHALAALAAQLGEADLDVPSEMTPEIAAATLKQRLADFLLDELKAMPRSWQELSENEQRQVLDRMDTQLRNAARSATYEIAARGFERVRISVTKVEFTPTGSKLTAGVSTFGGGIHELADRVGDDVIVVLADADAFIAGDMPKPDRDQLDLGLEGDDAKPFVDLGPVNTVGDEEAS